MTPFGSPVRTQHASEQTLHVQAKLENEEEEAPVQLQNDTFKDKTKIPSGDERGGGEGG